MSLKLLQKAQLVCMVLLLLAGGNAYAQNRITGTVTSSEDKQPIPGVQILIKGHNTGTVTDANGLYSISANSSDVLVFSFLGFKSREELVGVRTTIDVALATDEQRMEEIVVMGYSSTKKAELTSAVITVPGDALTDVGTPDVGNMLQGKIAGVMVYNSSGQPGTSAGIRVRGVGSINASAGPLFVVDGIPGGSYNPNDIETLTVLKDVGATAIYGASGANGVIVITTKSAKKGQPVKVEFKANGGVKQALMGRFSPMDSEELYYAQQQMYPATVFALQRPKWLLEEDFDWMNEAFGLGNLQNYYAAVSGSTGDISYRTSVDHYREKGTLINTNYAKTTVRMNLNARLFKNFDMTIRANYYEDSNSGSASYRTLEGAYRALPWDYPYDEDGNIVMISSSTRPDRPATAPGRPSMNNTWFGRDQLNILHDEKYNYSKSTGKGIDADVLFNWNITSWLSASSTNRFTRSDWSWTEFRDPQTKTGASSGQGGYLTINQGINQGFSTSNLVKAAYQWGDHSVNGLVGWEWGQGLYETRNIEATGMPAGMDVLEASIPVATTGYPTPSAGWSAFAQAQYNYQSKYFLTAVIRADKSTKFAPKKRLGYFPSVSGAWLVSNEKFLLGNEAITFLKLRASYGAVGNDNIGSFEYLNVFSVSSQYQSQIGAVPERLSNDYLQWETAITAGVGIDINLYDWLEVNLDYYDRKNKDLLLRRSKAPSTGFFERMENVGDMRNYGFEVQLTSTNWRTKDFTWTTSFNFAYNKNKMTKLPATEESPDGAFNVVNPSTSINQRVENGRDITSWYMPEWYGVDPDNGDPLWVGEDGNPTNVFNDAPYKIMGTALPTFYGGILNTFTYKGWSLSANFTYNYGNRIYNYTRNFMDSDGSYSNYNQMSIDNGLGWSRWEKAGDSATHPKLVLNGNQSSNEVSSRYLEDGSYLRLRNVTLSYNFPERWISKVKMSAARVYFSADNVFTLTKFSGTDPEVNLERTAWSIPGVYSMNYPVGRLFSLGLEVTF